MEWIGFRVTRKISKEKTMKDRVGTRSDGGRGFACGMLLLVMSVVCAGAARADEAFGYIPAEMNIIGVVDVHTVYTHEQMAELQSLVGDNLADEFAAMKVSFANMKRIVCGVHFVELGEEPRFVLVVEMKEEIDQDKLVAKMIDDGFEKKDVSGQVAYTAPGGVTDIGILSPKRVLVMSVELTEGVLSRANPITGNEALMAVADMPARTETIWVAAVPTKELLASFGDGVPPFVMDLQGVINTLHLGTNLDIRCAATFANEESANAIMGLMQMIIPGIMMHAAEFGIEEMPAVTVEGTTAKLSGSIPVETLSSFFSGPLRQAHESARIVRDMNNLKQIGGAHFMFVHDKKAIPGALHDLVEAGYVDDDEDLFVSSRMQGKVPAPHFAFSPHNAMDARSNEVIAWSIPHESVAGGVVLFMDNSVRQVKCTPEEYAKLIENLINRTNADEVTRLLPGANTQGFE